VGSSTWVDVALAALNVLQTCMLAWIGRSARALNGKTPHRDEQRR